jgi:hypothetical protein
LGSQLLRRRKLFGKIKYNQIVLEKCRKKILLKLANRVYSKSRRLRKSFRRKNSVIKY